MMERMGWTPGSGLGRSGQGRTGPLQASGNQSRDGLGYGSSKTTSLPSTLQFQSKLSKCTKQDQARALERLLSPVFELRGVIKEKMEEEEEVDDDDEESNQEEERRWYGVLGSKDCLSLSDSISETLSLKHYP